MVATKRPPSPDGNKVEHQLRTQIGREITELFKVWDDVYKSPEIMRHHGQVTINQIARLIEEAGIERGIVPKPEVATPH